MERRRQKVQVRGSRLTLMCSPSYSISTGISDEGTSNTCPSFFDRTNTPRNFRIERTAILSFISSKRFHVWKFWSCINFFRAMRRRMTADSIVAAAAAEVVAELEGAVAASCSSAIAEHRNRQPPSLRVLLSLGRYRLGNLESRFIRGGTLSPFPSCDSKIFEVIFLST